MYAVIKFTDEEKTRIVPTKDIKHLDVSHVNQKKKYLVKFGEDFYPAQVLLVKESVEELEDYQRDHRLRSVNKALLESASDTSESEADKPKKKIVSSLVHQTKAAKELESKLLNKVWKDRNENSLKPISTSQADKEVTLLKQEVKVLKSRIDDLSVQNAELTTLNMQLQKTVIDKFETFGQPVATNNDPKVGDVVNDQVHLGRGIYLHKSIFFDHWSRSTSGPQFVKNVAVSVFGVDLLLKSSVTGKQSNRIKKFHKKPPLDGLKLAAIEDIYKHYLTEKNLAVDVTRELKSIRTYLANKISDLNRTHNRQQRTELVPCTDGNDNQPFHCEDQAVEEEDVEEADVEEEEEEEEVEEKDECGIVD